MKPTILSQFLVALVASALLLAGYSYINGAKKNVVIEHVDKSPVQKAVYTLDEAGNPVPLDFVGVAENSVSAVVHIIATSGINRTNAKEETYIDPFGRKFRMQPRGNQPSVGSGSGVIINNDGYIVTNNHVVTGADDLEVHLNDKRKFKAKLIGTDPQTDIAVIKIDQKDLNSLKFSNSDMVKVGQWVLAIGNPFNLTSTVTAGIVSAKGRNIDINQTLGGIESFIQTDAAINPGNSGGALVDLNGNLIGINTAIASQTGSYAGYGFAVPANIASRVVSDLIQFGSTQRGYLGVTVVSLESPQAKTQGIKLTEGALIGSVSENSAAKKAGILANDVVVAINDHKVGTSADLIEFVGSHRIGDEIKVKVNRKGDEKIFTVKLQNDKGTLAA
ncbi:MAG: trypsin-like peptidase domain-containing protein, partial [Saprospiraceae bacterium]